MQKSSAVLSRIEDIQVPLLVVHGLADTLLPPEHGRDIALRVSGAELVEVEGMGHDLEGPFSTRVADEVIRFAGKA